MYDRVYQAQCDAEHINEQTGYLLVDQIMDISDKYSLSLEDIDKLSENLSLKGILIYDECPINVISNEEISDYAHEDYDYIFQQVVKKDPSLCTFIKQIKQIKPAQYGEIQELKYLVCEGNEYAINRFYLIHIRRAVALALKYYREMNLELSDAIQIGCLSIAKALERYDATKNGPFGSYVSMYILNELQRNYSYNPLIRFPVHIIEHLKKIEKQNHINLKMQKYYFSNYRILINESTYGELLAKDIINECMNCISIEDDSNAEEIGEFGEENTNEECQFYSSVIKEIIDRSSLNDREKTVLKMRYGIGDMVEGKTLEEIGDKFGLTRERVRQIEKKALIKLKPLAEIVLKQYQ